MKRYVKARSWGMQDVDVASSTYDEEDETDYAPFIATINDMIDKGSDLKDLYNYLEECTDRGDIDDIDYRYLRKIARQRYNDAMEARDDDADDMLYGLSRGTYSVSAFSNAYMEPVGAPTIYSDPGKAIKKWFQLNESYPTCVMITGYRGEDEQALRDWAVNHEDKIIEWAGRYASPYGSEYIIEECKKPVRPSSIKAPDQLHPFGLG